MDQWWVMQLFHIPPHWKSPRNEKYFTGTLRSESSRCSVRLSFSVQFCHMRVCVGSYTPAAARARVLVCACMLRAHTNSPVCRLALSVRSMNGKHSQLRESPISNWVGLSGWSAVLPHLPSLSLYLPFHLLPTGKNTISRSLFFPTRFISFKKWPPGLSFCGCLGIDRGLLRLEVSYRGGPRH